MTPERDPAGGPDDFVHQACGFPVYQDERGNWQHTEAADSVLCDLLFSGGSMLDSLVREEYR